MSNVNLEGMGAHAVRGVPYRLATLVGDRNSRQRDRTVTVTNIHRFGDEGERYTLVFIPYTSAERVGRRRSKTIKVRPIFGGEYLWSEGSGVKHADPRDKRLHLDSRMHQQFVRASRLKEI